jgi:hypothetical protein
VFIISRGLGTCTNYKQGLKLHIFSFTVGSVDICLCICVLVSPCSILIRFDMYRGN